MDSDKLPEFFYEIFDASLPRLGPGDEASTLKALNMLRWAKLRRKNPAADRTTRILDLGCGNGVPTLILARHTQGSILAVDNHQPFLDELQHRAAAAGVSERIQVSLRDMRSLDKGDGPFDLIWSEGALFVMGFREGLAACHALLAPGGGLAVSEICLAPARSAGRMPTVLRYGIPGSGRHRGEPRRHPGLRPGNPRAFPPAGIGLVGALLPSARSSPAHLAHAHAGEPEKLSLIEQIQKEIDIYRQYSAFYGNVFFVMRRR